MISGNPTRARMPDDWVGAFYPFSPKGTTQQNINRRLLMYGGSEGMGRIIPFGKIYGVFYDVENDLPVFKLNLAPVGQTDSQSNFLKHLP